MRHALIMLLCGSTVCFAQTDLPQIPPIKRQLPPVGNALEPADRTRLLQEIERLETALPALEQHPQYADAAVLVKSVRFAVDLNEFYREADVKKAAAILELADKRIKQLATGKTPTWPDDHGRVVLGYRSDVDASLQPFAMEIPENLDLKKSQPLYVWLHGRGDSATDMHFIDQRINKPGTIKVDDAFIVHPFGRQCVGFKHAGEIDVLDVIDRVADRYPVDRDRIVLIGFSMGGAGAWHVGAHYTDRFAAVCPGAGFAETKLYQNLSPEQYPPAWEQTLWSVYDVPNFVRNLFNTRVIAYSGENDKQIQAARVMEAAYEAAGRSLDHRIGPGMGHKYHPDTLAEILHDLKTTIAKPADPMRPLHLQTTTLRYNRIRWITVTQLQQHYRETRVDARQNAGRWMINTTNVSQMTIDPPGASASIVIDKQPLAIAQRGPTDLLRHASGVWAVATTASDTAVSTEPNKLSKRPGLQGPIDDVFMRPFLVVLPTGPGFHAETDRWVEFESNQFVQRWKALMRGTLRVKTANEVTPQDIKDFNLILWGDPQSNPWIGKVLSDRQETSLPLQWDAQSITLAKARVEAAGHVPVMIYPNPANPERYVAINAGLTFREGQDRTNSLQNPRLPDWALIGLDQLPDGNDPGRIEAAGFFSESWRED